MEDSVSEPSLTAYPAPPLPPVTSNRLERSPRAIRMVSGPKDQVLPLRSTKVTEAGFPVSLYSETYTSVIPVKEYPFPLSELFILEVSSLLVKV